MKKNLMGLFLVLGMASFAANAGKVEVKGGYDLGGKYKIKDAKNNTYIKNIDEDIDAKRNAFEAGAEYRYEVTPGLEVGAGVAYQQHNDLKDSKGELYNSVPIYGTAKYTFDTPTVVKPYIKGDLGYSANTDKAKDGLYYGAGAGVNVNNVNVDVMYKENQGEYKYEGPVRVNSKYDANYRRVSLGVGYNFNLGN